MHCYSAKRGLPTEGTLAHVAVSKYADHLPLYRQCQIYGPGGLDLDRSTLAKWRGVASLIETCKLNAVDPFAYLRETLTAIANRHPASRIDALMPWAFQKSAT